MQNEQCQMQTYFALCILQFAFLTSACARAPEPAKASVRPITLPDLSRMETPVQEQLRVAYAALTEKIAKSAPPADLAQAYGALGNLLLAAEYLDAAESCYL